MTETMIKKPSWWNKRSTLEKSLIFLLLITVLTACILAIGIFLSIISFVRSVPPCLTPECIEAASNILNRMNRSVDPCENFYEFACGNFKNIVEIPESEERVFSLSTIGNKIQNQLRKLLEEPSHPKEARSFLLGKKFYELCSDENLIEEQDLEPLKNLLSELGGWPLLEGNKWNENEFDWKELNYKLRNKGLRFNQLLQFFVSEDAKNGTQKLLHIRQANLDLLKDYVDLDIDDSILRAYYQYMIDLTTALGANETAAETEMTEVFLFQRNISEISLSQIELRNVSALYNKMTVAELQKMHPYIQWLEYFNKILSPVLQINETEIIINQTPSYFTKLEELLNNTPQRTIANYIYWCVVRSLIYELPKKIQKIESKFIKSVSRTKSEPRWKKCISKTKNYFNLVTGSLYVRKSFNKELKNKILEIVANIKGTFEDNLKRIDWMDSNTKNSAVEKLKAMFEHVAYPDELLDDEKLDNVYKNLNIDENSYLISINSINKFRENEAFRRIREPVNKTDWRENGDVASPNAFYYGDKNSFTLPAGILQDIFFSSYHPNYMNYGAIGVTIGHEITHGFDNEGRQRDKDGHSSIWWDSNTEKAFLEKAQCFIDQYNKYLVSEINQTVDGELTQGENIADNGGAKQAYYAYKKWLQRNNKEDQLPGLSYTPLQMFWISMANTWCVHYRPNTLKLLVKGNEHAPYPFRVIGSLSNRPEFAQDFNCPSGSKMNPKNKCEIW